MLKPSPRSGYTQGPSQMPSTIVVEKQPAGWRVNLGGRISYFGTQFLAIETATDAARRALAGGRKLTVLVRKGDGAWQTAWSPDDPYPV